MEEAEAISHNIGIMVAGKLKCYGPLNAIQQEYGLGYDISINLNMVSLFDEIPEPDQENRFTNNRDEVKNLLYSIKNTWTRSNHAMSLDPEEEFSRAGILGVYHSKVAKGENIDLMAIRKEVVF